LLASKLLLPLELDYLLQYLRALSLSLLFVLVAEVAVSTALLEALVELVETYDTSIMFL
jgi:hypothetical protein